MSPKYLFGPVGRDYADENLFTARQRGQCLAFHSYGAPDVVIREADSWPDIVARFPTGWFPDFIALMLPYNMIPTCLWHAPVPLIGLAGDWHLLWHHYGFVLPRCDLVVTDTRGIERLSKIGVAAVPGNLFGHGRAFQNASISGPRDIDILFVGSLHPAEQRDRLPWLRRLATAFGDRWNVVVRGGIGREESLDLLRRARIVFNRGVRRECNLRAFEATSMGALLFQEAENEEVRNYFKEGEECVFYTTETLEPQLEYYLKNEAARRRLADAAAKRAAAFSFAELWAEVVRLIVEREVDLERMAARRVASEPRTRDPAASMWEAFCCHTGPDRTEDIEPSLIATLERVVADQPSARAYSLLGLAIARHGQRHDAFDRNCVTRVAAMFRRAVELALERPLLRLNLAEALWRLDDRGGALDECGSALALIEGQTGVCEEDRICGHFPPAYDTFRVEWEKAAWTHAGCPRKESNARLRLLRWRLYSLMAALSGELTYYRLAVESRDDLWTSHAALGRALLRADRPLDAARALSRATELNPFDPTLSEDCLAALLASGDHASYRRVAEEWRLLSRAVASNGCPEIRFAQEVTR